MVDKELKEKKLNKLMDIALIIMGVIITFNISIILLNRYGDTVDSGVVMKLEYLFESDVPVEDVIREQGWEEIDDETALLRAISNWTYQNIRYPSGVMGDNNNAYETLEAKAGNCLGQAHLVYLFCRKLNVEAYLLQFINGNIGHAVNIIDMEDGKGYYVMDTTIHYFGRAADYFHTYDVKGIDYSLPEYWAERLADKN